jgi:hypothetical protein
MSDIALLSQIKLIVGVYRIRARVVEDQQALSLFGSDGDWTKRYNGSVEPHEVAAGIEDLLKKTALIIGTSERSHIRLDQLEGIESTEGRILASPEGIQFGNSTAHAKWYVPVNSEKALQAPGQQRVLLIPAAIAEIKTDPLVHIMNSASEGYTIKFLVYGKQPAT